MLRIAVCVKQVPSGQITMDSETGILKREESSGCMNMYDYVAVETALRIRQKCECQINVFTMGPVSS
ncbi:MAG: electron transfer flavoprotein subunit beta, partial [Lachnospiraceae bacterium]